MPALIELDCDEVIISNAHGNSKRKKVMVRGYSGDHRIQKKSNQISTRNASKNKHSSYKVIANSIYVDTNWTEYLENCPIVLELICSFLELKDIVQYLVYVSKFWQDFILEKYTTKFKEEYVLENELFIYRKFRIDSSTSDFMDNSNSMEDEGTTIQKKVKFSVENEGEEIIPPELNYDRNLRGKFLFSDRDTPERYALFVRYTCLDRAREAISRYVNYLLDGYSQCSGNDAKNFRKFIGWNEWNIIERNHFHQSLLEQSNKWYSFSYSFETDKKLTEMFDMSKDVVIFSGSFANFDVEIKVEKSGNTRVVFDDVAQFDESPMKTMENYNSITWIDEERFISKQKYSNRDMEMID